MHCRVAVSSTTEEPLIVRRELPLAWCVINRPAAHNALSAAVWRELSEQVTALGEDDDVRVIIVRGAGEQAFISGADITEFRALRGSAAMTAEYDRLSARAWSALNMVRQPVIAMINGLCFGGGVSIAVACDLRFAADHARFAVPAARLGLAYPLPAVERLLQVVGVTHAADILLSTRAFDAAEAERMGFVNRVVPSAQLEEHTRTYALAMAECAPLTLAAHKLAIQHCLQSPDRRDTAALRAAVQRCFDSSDYQEGIAAFLEKRKPRFQGK
jgi:enoyl-CoA hydratase/carnithine racemase